MKKITLFFSLCLTMLFVGTMTAKAEIGDALDRTGWSIVASSSCDDAGSGQPIHIIDGDNDTFWHSNWGGSNATGVQTDNLPEWFVVDLGSVQELGGFSYRPRSTHQNGAVFHYKVYVSNEPFANVVTPITAASDKDVIATLENHVKEGNFTWTTGDDQSVSFDAAVSGQYVLFVVLDAQTDVAPRYYANCSEFNLFTFAEDAKPVLIEKIATFTTLVEGATVGENPGYYSAATVEAANNAIAAAQAVVDNEESTDAEESEAIAALEEAVAAFQPNAVVTGLYQIVSGLPKYFEKQGVEKALYAKGTALAWGTVNADSPYYYWNITVTESGITVQSAVSDAYINGIGLSASENTVTLNAVGSGQFNIVANGSTLHTNGHSEGSGVGADIVNWGGGVNSASSWKLVKVEAMTDAALAELEVARLKASEDYVALKNYIAGNINAWAETMHGQLPGIITDATKLTSNSVSTQEGENGPTALLIDGNTDTYYHGGYGSQLVNETNYLQVALDAPAGDFWFYMNKRAGNNNNRPSKITVSGSTDGETFTEIRTFNWEFGFNAPSSAWGVVNGGDYTTLRFYVDETNSGTKFFTASEFQLHAVPEDASVKAVIDLVDAFFAIDSAEDLAAAQAKFDVVNDMLNPVVAANYRAAKRAATLEEGKTYVIFNTTFDGTQDRTGVISSNGSGVVLNKILPSGVVVERESDKNVFWQVKPVADQPNVYNLIASNGKFVANNGSHNETNTIAITEFTAFTGSKPGGENVQTLNEDGTKTLLAEATAENKIWAISTPDNSSCWNGNPDTWTTWQNAHPYAFYEVFEYTDEELALFATAQDVISMTGVGYPVASEANNAIKAVIDSLLNVNPLGNAVWAEELEEAVYEYMAITDVQLPEGGKFYTFKVVNNAGDMAYYNYTGSDVELVAYNEGDELPTSAMFYCLDNGDGTNTFMTNDAQYLVYHSKYAGVNWLAGGGSTTGFQSTRDDMTNITISKLLNGGSVSAYSQSELFGLMTWYSLRGYDTGKGGVATYGNVVIKADFSDYDGASAPFYNNNFTSAFLVEEAAGFELPTLAVDSISPAVGQLEEAPAQISVKFSCAVAELGYAILRTDKMARGESINLAETAVIADSTVTFTLPVEEIADASVLMLSADVMNVFGQHATYGGYAEGMVYLEYTVPQAVVADLLEPVSTTVETNEAGAVVSLLLVFDDTTNPFGTSVQGFDEAKEVVVKNAADEVVATGTFAYGDDWDDARLTLSTPIEADGTYTLVVPEATVYAGAFDASAPDFGVSYGAIYNPEYTYEFTVGAPEPAKLTVTGITPEAGSTVAEISTITLTFSEAIIAWATDTPEITNAAGETVYKFKGTEVKYGEDGTTATFTLPETAVIRTAGEYTLVVEAGIFMNAAYEANEAATFKLIVNPLTGIEGVEVDEANAAIYDLAGRRVNATVKGGVYVKNGKKFIAE